MIDGTIADSAVKEIKQLGERAVLDLIGPGVVDKVEVSAGEGSLGDPVYFFYLRIDEARPPPTSLQLVKLSQRLRDELIGRNDLHYPFVTMLRHADWSRLTRVLAN